MPHQSDGNAASIVSALRAVGASVELIASPVRRAGIPDLLIGFRGRNWLLEVKRPASGPRGGGAGVLSEDQRAFIATWRGSVAVVTSVVEALRAVGLEPG
jgi:hypothetical protein